MSSELKTEPNVTQGVPLYGVGDIQKSVRFYVDGLGFTKKVEWAPEGVLRWCWLELDNVAVMLQEFRKDGHHASVPTSDVGIGVSMNYNCKDALAIYHAIKSRGIEAERPFVGNSMWVVGVIDPDGYRLYFQSPTDVAEETVYSE